MYVRQTSNVSPWRPPGLRSRSYVGPRYRGVGSTTSVTAATIAAQGATTTGQLLVAFSVIAPPWGAVIAGIAAVGVLLARVFQGCGQTCVQATTYANQVEVILQQNLQTYLGSSIRTVSMQAAAVNNYNTAIASLQAACGQAALQQAGVNCIDERIDPSSCQWKAAAGGWSSGSCPATYAPWGASGSGSSCWNWVIGYLDPIQNDPCVQPDSVLLAAAGSSSGTAPQSSSAPASTVFGVPIPFAIAGLVAAAFLLGGD